MVKVARKKTFTQTELFQATHELMLAVGYDNFSFQLLANELDITRTALYKYYGNKTDLLRDYLNHQMEDIVGQLSSAKWPSDYQEKLSHLIDLIIGFSETHRISNMIPDQKWKQVANEKPEVQRSKELHSQFFRFIYDMIEEGQNNGFLDATIPPLVIVETIFHSIMLPNHAKLTTEERAYYLKRMLFNGIVNR